MSWICNNNFNDNTNNNNNNNNVGIINVSNACRHIRLNVKQGNT